MEKIQAALAKARAARAAGQGAPVAAPAAPEAGPVADTRAAPPPSPAPAANLGPEAPPAIAPTTEFTAAESMEAAWLALPGFTPKPRALQKARVTAWEAGAAALPFDVLRTRLLQQMRGNGWLKIGITSPGPRCGKSVLALNLAFSLARQTDQRTLLIEADLRRPTLARYLGLKARHNVARVLEGQAPFSDHAVRYGVNLAIATQTTPLRAPAEILQSPAARAALDEMARRYAPTVMLFDLPPMSAGDDVMALAGALDAMLIIAAADLTTVAQVDQCERELAAQVAVMGVVLTKCRYAEEAGYGYGY